MDNDKDDRSVDLSLIDAKSIKVSVNGKDLPLAIGSKIDIENNDSVVRTIVGIKIDVEGNAAYCLEWFDGVNFKADWVSLNELYFMHMNMKKKNKISLN